MRVGYVDRQPAARAPECAGELERREPSCGHADGVASGRMRQWERNRVR